MDDTLDDTPETYVMPTEQAQEGRYMDDTPDDTPETYVMPTEQEHQQGQYYDTNMSVGEEAVTSKSSTYQEGPYMGDTPEIYEMLSDIDDKSAEKFGDATELEIPTTEVCEFVPPSPTPTCKGGSPIVDTPTCGIQLLSNVVTSSPNNGKMFKS